MGSRVRWRNMTRMKTQLTRDRLRLQSEMECLLEEDADQAVRRGQRSAGRQRTSHSAGFSRGRERPQEIGSLGRRPVEVQRGATSRCFDGKSAVDAPGNAGAATGAAAD